MGKWAKAGLGIAVAGVFVWMIARHVDGAALLATLREASPGWILAAVAMFFIGYACRIRRWQIMLTRDNPDIGWRTCAVPFMGSIAANNVLPFRAGDALRAFAFTRWLGVGAPAVLATLLVERLLDLLTLLLALGLALLLLEVSQGASALVGTGAGGLIAVAAAVACVLLFPRLFAPLARACTGLVSRFAAGIGEKLQDVVARIFDTLSHLAQGPRMAVLVLWSLAAWACEGAVFYCTARAVPALTEPLAGWLALPVGTLATLLPSTPGYVGTFDFFVIKAAEAMGNPALAAVAFALLVHMVLWLPATAVGGACLAYWSLKRGPVLSKSHEAVQP